ncbi:hypothetical protein ACJX0J_036520 [Zea mays]
MTFLLLNPIVPNITVDKLEYELQLKNLLLEEETKMKRLKIHALMDNGRLVEDEEDINKLATDYYINLFGPSNISTIHMYNMNMKRLSDEDKDSLTVPFTLEEIHKEFWDTNKKEIWDIWMLKDLIMTNLPFECHQFGFLKEKNKMGLFSK